MRTAFTPYGKTPRLNRDIIVTEKIDGTNAAIRVEEGVWVNPSLWDEEGVTASIETEDTAYTLIAQSRNRIITPNSEGRSTDNAGFAGWVREHALPLALLLGAGIHFGEWYGQGIQRAYGLDHKRFALFNPDRYKWESIVAAQLSGVAVETVPVLYRGPNSTSTIRGVVEDLRLGGSHLPEALFYPAEGAIVFHTASRQVYKVLCENDDMPKSLAGAA